jgi:hypothetical protein
VTRAVVTVVEAESPIHDAELSTRVASRWNTRANSRVQQRILEACRQAEQAGLVRRRGEFVWSNSAPCRARSRAGTKIAADRIAPEEYESAVLDVLAQGHGFDRAHLVNEVRAVLGFQRTGPALEAAIVRAIEALLASGKLGEGGSGIRLRAG